ncbi:MAG: cation transporter [Anaerolineae bacterium]|nr:cation transporter [Anaerolineae bacterium]
MNLDQRERKSLIVVNLGLAANIFLAGLKTGMGILGHSPALLADGINSTSDVAYYVVVGIFMRLACKPPDKEHPYGHHQLESIAALIVGAFVITTAVTIFWTAINDIYDLLMGQSDFAGATVGALWVALLTIFLKIGLTTYTRRVGQKTDNLAVLALARDHRNDIFSALAATIGIFLGRMGYLWVDPLAGALVALVVLRTGVEILRESSTNLMDTIPGQTLAQQILDLLRQVPGVNQIEEIHAHRFGPYLVMNLTICVDGSLSVTEGDRIACEVENTLYQNIDFLRRVYVHYHPLKSAQLQPVGRVKTHPTILLER